MVGRCQPVTLAAMEGRFQGGPDARVAVIGLTPREIDVLRLIAGGNANKEIAAHSSLTEEAVNGHVKNILAKLGAKNRTHAVRS